MRTDDLIAELAGDLKPVKPGALTRLLALGLGAGAAVAALMMLGALGLRADLRFAATTSAFWMKAGYTVSLGIIAFALVRRAGRPGLGLLPLALLALGALLIMTAMALMQTMRAPAELRRGMFFGGSYQVCPWLIVALSLPILVAMVLALRRMAPTRPMEAGGAAGLLAGAAGATVYGLHCTESSALFVAFWYTLGILTVGAVGALGGRFALRW